MLLSTHCMDEEPETRQVPLGFKGQAQLFGYGFPSLPASHTCSVSSDRPLRAPQSGAPPASRQRSAGRQPGLGPG